MAVLKMPPAHLLDGGAAHQHHDVLQLVLEDLQQIRSAARLRQLSMLKANAYGSSAHLQQLLDARLAVH
jgi:hypothetical protein